MLNTRCGARQTTFRIRGGRFSEKYCRTKSCCVPARLGNRLVYRMIGEPSDCQLFENVSGNLAFGRNFVTDLLNTAPSDGKTAPT